MRRIFGLMISPNSLAAFSASASAGLASTRGIQPAATPLRVAATAPARPKAAAPVGTPAPGPGQVLPRGSLLDLRV